MKNRRFGPYLAARCRILVLVMWGDGLGCKGSPLHSWSRGAAQLAAVVGAPCALRQVSWRCVRRVACAAQLTGSGAASFTLYGTANGKAGVASFREAEEAPELQLAVEEEALRKAAQVIIGRIDIAELLGPRVADSRARQVGPLPRPFACTR
jgi:hypothetical protein